MPSRTSSLRLILVLAFVLPMGTPLVIGQADAQRYQPSAPVLVKNWTCSRCKGLLGQGSVKPRMERCPHCKARLGGGGWFSRSSSSSSSSSGQRNSTTSVEDSIKKNFNFSLGMPLLVFAGVAGAVFWVFSSARTSRPTTTRRVESSGVDGSRDLRDDDMRS